MGESRQKLYDKYGFYPSPETIKCIRNFSIAMAISEQDVIDRIKSVMGSFQNDMFKVYCKVRQNIEGKINE